MGKPRRKHSREFKLKAVRLVVEQGRTVRDMAENLGVNASLLQHRKSQVKPEGALAFPGNGRQSAADGKLRRLRMELAQARQKRDILKKATACFAREQS